MNTRKSRAKRTHHSQDEYVVELDDISHSPRNDSDDQEEARKSRIRDSNKEFARRMTILQTWSDYWSDFTTRDGEAYPQQQAKDIIKKTKKITCPIEKCNKSFTSIGGLKYHYARCNITRCFKCKVCNPFSEYSTRGEILRHMILSHYDDLPALNNEQKEIANSYLSCENRNEKSKKTRRISADTEASCNSQSLIKSYYDLQNRVFLSEDYSNRPYKDWQSFAKDWEVMSSEYERKQYYPPEFESVQFKSNKESGWKVLRAGESMNLLRDKKGAPISTAFYTGGINTASAWQPKSHYDPLSNMTPDLVAISVNACSMNQSLTYKDSQTLEGCVQFWTVGSSTEGDGGNMKIELSYAIGHNYGTIFEMLWCPLGTSWQPQVNTGDAISRSGLLALACGDGQIRILNIPHTNSLLDKVISRTAESILESIPFFKTRPIATLMPPGVGLSTDYQTTACKSISWSLESNQRFIAAGYTNGNVAMFDLANSSPILYLNADGQHIYQPLKSWIAHGAPVTGIAIVSTGSLEETLIATGSSDRQLKIWHPLDLNSFLTSDRAPITRISWDYRFRGIVTATDTAFTSFNNRVSYRYPIADGNHNVTVSAHRSTVWGLSNSVITNAIATSDGAGELFVMPQLINRSLHKRDRSILSTHSLYTLIPQTLNNGQDKSITEYCANAPADEFNRSAVNNESNDASAQAVLVNSTNNEADENGLEADADFYMVEREIANKPTKFLLPIEHHPVESYSEFKDKFGLEFVGYNHTTTKPEAKLPESCIRAGDSKNIYCDRPCDYPFSSINNVSWSPNPSTFSHLLSITQIGLCRLDRVQIVEQVNKGYVDSILLQNKQRAK